MTYATVSFLEPETQAEQQRITAIVKTSDKGGYYIDVFRSRGRQDPRLFLSQPGTGDEGDGCGKR